MVDAQFACNANIGTATCTLDTATRTIMVRDAFSNDFSSAGSITISLFGLKNSAFAAATDSFTVLTQTTSGIGTTAYLIDQATSGLTVVNTCDYPCKTCDATVKSTCLSCFVDQTLNILDV